MLLAAGDAVTASRRLAARAAQQHAASTSLRCCLTALPPNRAGIPIDGKTVFTSDHALKLEWLPNWIAIIGSGYIGLEFSDVYTALGCEVTFIEAMPNIMPGFDKEIARMAQRLLIQGRPIDYHTNVLATKVTPGVPGEWQEAGGRRHVPGQRSRAMQCIAMRVKSAMQHDVWLGRLAVALGRWSILGVPCRGQCSAAFASCRASGSRGGQSSTSRSSSTHALHPFLTQPHPHPTTPHPPGSQTSPAQAQTRGAAQHCLSTVACPPCRLQASGDRAD